MGARDVAVILSAGASTRFGGRPKALLPVWGESAIGRMVRVAREEGFDPCVVVGAHAAEIRGSLSSTALRIVENSQWSLGRTGSIQVGLAAVGSVTSALLWPVDHPFVQAMTLRRLRVATEHDAMGVWFIPTFDGSGGHPVLVKPSVLPRIQSLAPTDSLRTLFPTLGAGVVRVPVDDPGVQANVDTVETFDRFVSLHPRPEEPL